MTSRGTGSHRARRAARSAIASRSVLTTAATATTLGLLAGTAAPAFAAPAQDSTAVAPSGASEATGDDSASGRNHPDVRELGRLWAEGDGPGAAEQIERAGFAGNPTALGHALANADGRVLEAGPTHERVAAFAEAVDLAYREAGVSPAVASASFGIGLADVLADYAAAPSDPTVWGPAQADIGSSILLRVVPRWVAPPQGPMPTTTDHRSATDLPRA